MLFEYRLLSGHLQPVDRATLTSLCTSFQVPAGELETEEEVVRCILVLLEKDAGLSTLGTSSVDLWFAVAVSGLIMAGIAFL